VLALRARQQRNFLVTLLLSQGVPMLLGGDELGRTQQGNNNAWCQDNELSWYDWERIDEELLSFVRRVIALRRSEPVFRRRDFLVGEGAELPDVVWFRPDGKEMGDEDWDARTLGVFLNGEEIPTHDREGNPIEGGSFLILFNAHHEPVAFTIAEELGGDWEIEFSTGEPNPVAARSVVVLRRL
jgi:glycogen operon protein